LESTRETPSTGERGPLPTCRTASRDALRSALPTGAQQPDPDGANRGAGSLPVGPDKPAKAPGRPLGGAAAGPGGAPPAPGASEISKRTRSRGTISTSRSGSEMNLEGDGAQLHRHRDFARYPRRFSIPILGRLSFSTLVSPACLACPEAEVKRDTTPALRPVPRSCLLTRCTASPRHRDQRLRAYPTPTLRPSPCQDAALVYQARSNSA